MTTNNTTTTTDVVTITRVFDAPRARVWQAWTDPTQMPQWWGPKAFTIPACQIDLRVGGRYLYCMRTPQGEDVWGTGVYREVRAPERLVMTDSFADADGNVVSGATYGMGDAMPLEMVIAITFSERDGQTTMTLEHIGMPPGEMRDMASAGWNESFDRLAAFLAR